MSAVEVSKGPVKEFWGDANVISLQENTSLKGQLIPGTAEVLGNPQDQPEVVRLSPEGEPVQGYCRLGHVQWLLRQHPTHGWIVVCAGCFGGCGYGGILL